MIKAVFMFDPNSGEFTGTYDAHHSKEEPGKYIAPDCSTEEPLPALNAGEVAVRLLPDGTVPKNGMDGAWVVKEDHRSEVWYDLTTGAEVVIDTLDIPVTLAATKPPAIVLDETKAAQIADINIKCASAIVGGFDSSALGTVHHYTATLEDQSNLLGLIAIGTGGEFTCTDASGVKARRPHTLAELKTVLADGGAFKDRCLARARLLKDQIAAIQPSATAADDVKAIVWTLQ